MQSVTVYGRFIVRALLSELGGSEVPALSWLRECHRPALRGRSYHLVAASAGIAKTHAASGDRTARAMVAAAAGGIPDGVNMSDSPLSDRTYGDDAFFFAKHRLCDVLGVADGVGGWKSYGVDPSKFPTSLMSVCERMVKEGKFDPLKPVDLISSGFTEIQHDKAPLVGSCTACVVSFHHTDSTLYTANLGDSGFMVVREGRVIHRSEEQQHYFNTPYQLSVAPASLEGMVLSDRPESAQTSSVKLEEGDIILLGTDGLFDNMKDTQILQHLAHLKDFSIETIQGVANSIAAEAHKLGFQPDYISPFSMNAKANGFNFIGGKPDDVTVLIARVTLSNDSPQV